MAREILSALRNLFATEDAGERIHFHAGPAGKPAVCEFPRCDRPALTVGDR